MRTGKRITLRRVILFAWIVLVLMVVAPVLAQDGDGEGTPLGEDGQQFERTTPVEDRPDDLTEVAVELMPLLLGAALIERVLEYIFTLSETALLRARRVMRWFFEWVNGTIMVDAREIYAHYAKLRQTLLKYHTELIDETTPKNPASTNPDDWPFEQVMEQFELYSAKIAQLEEWLDTTTSSQAYINRRKNVASIMGVVMGLFLSVVAELRIFEPLGFGFAGMPGEVFDVVDWIGAGVLMGLGTDYVHQVVSVLTKGQRFLGAATGRPAPRTVQVDLSAIRRDFDTQFETASQALEQRFEAVETALNRLGVDVDVDADEPPGT
jgi:hypothetical protein